MNLHGQRTVSFWRVAALVLLLCAGFDILAVHATLLLSPSSAECCGDSLKDEESFCCCRHIVIAAPPIIPPLRITAVVDNAEPPPFTPIPAPVPYHPPRA